MVWLWIMASSLEREPTLTSDGGNEGPREAEEQEGKCFNRIQFLRNF